MIAAIPRISRDKYMASVNDDGRTGHDFHSEIHIPDGKGHARRQQRVAVARVRHGAAHVDEGHVARLGVHAEGREGDDAALRRVAARRVCQLDLRAGGGRSGGGDAGSESGEVGLQE